MKANDQRAAAITQLLRFDAAAEANVLLLEEAQTRFDEVAREAGLHLLEARRKVIASQAAFLDCLRELMPGFNRLGYAVDPAGTAELEDLMRELVDKGATLRIVRAEQFGTGRPTPIIDPHAYKPPPLAFLQVAEWIETIVKGLEQEQPTQTEDKTVRLA